MDGARCSCALMRSEKTNAGPSTRCARSAMTEHSYSVRQDGFVAEDAVEGGAADAELAGGA